MNKQSLITLIYILVFLITPTFITNALAGNRSKDEMKMAALNVLSTRSKARGITANAETFELKEYVAMEKLSIIGSEGLGFAVVTNDDRFDEVIGYSFTNYSEEMPSGFKWWLEAANEVMEEARGQEPAKTRAGNLMKTTGVSPLITTKWGQGKPFNNKCNITVAGKDYSLLTGCVATAMAQVMNYYKYPLKGEGENSYKINYLDWGEKTYYANFKNSYYDWDNMLDDYSSYSLKPEDKYTDAVSLLMSDCGKAVNMIYTTYWSGAYNIFVPNGLKNYFSYSFLDETNKIYYRNSFSNDDWMNLIYDALSNNHPILYSGNDQGHDGHMFVIHGYEPDGKVIINWGWNGSYDGSFMIDMLSPGGYVFNDNQQMIIPIPKMVDTNEYKLTYIINGEVYKEYKLKAGDEITPEPTPIKEGYTFSGWSAIPQTMPANDLTITGSFTKGTYKLTYIIDNEVYKTMYYDFGTAINTETTPTKVGYTFSGWSEIPKTMPAKDITVTGSFTINKYKLTYEVDGEVYKTYEMEYGAKITPEAEPTKAGYTFLGWSNIPSTMPNHNVTVIGAFDETIIYGSIIKYKGILYQIIDDYVLVGRQDKGLSGNIVLPASISCENKTYPVLGFVEPTNLTAWSSNTVTTEGGAFQDCQITSIVIPSSITKITAGAFNGCTKLKSVTMPDNLESIGAASFSDCI